MPALLRDRVARFVCLTAAVGSLADWMLFATMVVTVDRLLGSTPWATALVLVARILPGVAFAPLAARRIDRGDLVASLRVHEGLRIAAVLVVAAGFAGGSVVAVLGGIVALEFAAAMQAAGRESVISRHVPPVLFTAVNTATAVASYALLPVGSLIVAAVGAPAGWILAVGGYAVVALGYGVLHLPSRTHGTRAAASATGAASDGGWQRVVAAAALGLLPAVALFAVGPDLGGAWLGDRTATGVLYGTVLVGAGLGVILANTARIRAEVAMVLAAAGLGVALAGMWPIGLFLLGTGAGAAYLLLQTRLQHAASDPSEFAAAFAGLKIAAAAGVVGAPLLVTVGGVPTLLAAGAVVALAGAAVASPAPARAVQLAVRETLAVVLHAVVRVEVHNRSARVAGPAVVVSNHPHWLDGPVALLHDRSLRPIARWQRHPGARMAIWAGGCVVTTTGTDRGRRPAFARAADHLHDGGRVWLAPEGGAHDETVLRPPRSGAVRMAAAAGVPIQPLAIAWTDGYAGPDLSRWRPWRRPRVRLTWGDPVMATGDVVTDNHRMMIALARAAGLDYRPPVPEVAA